MSREYPKIQSRLELISAIRKEIDDIQNACTHEGLLGAYGANTGNYCKQDDSYWVTFLCPECGERWTEDQEEVGYQSSKKGFKFTKVKNV